MEIAVLGPVELLGPCGGREVGGPRMRRLAAMLALANGSQCSLDSLIEAVWSDSAAPSGARRTLMSYVSRLRSLLPPGAVHQSSGGYRLQTSVVGVDADAFAREVSAGRAAVAAGRNDVAADAFGRALRRWRGDPLAEFAGEFWVEPDRVRLCELWLSATEGWFEAGLNLGHGTALVADLERAAMAYPHRDRFHILLMSALHESGRQVEALRHYQRVRGQLADVGLEPSPALRAVEHRILTHDVGLAS